MQKIAFGVEIQVLGSWNELKINSISVHHGPATRGQKLVFQHDKKTKD